jgi:hypothetical protein
VYHSFASEGTSLGLSNSRTKGLVGSLGRSHPAEPNFLIEQLKNGEAIAEADTLLMTVPNQLGVACDAHVIEAIPT